MAFDISGAIGVFSQRWANDSGLKEDNALGLSEVRVNRLSSNLNDYPYGVCSGWIWW